MKRPSEMSREEIDALPIRPAFPAGKASVTAFLREDIAAYIDGEGNAWAFGQNPDGSWHKYKHLFL